MCYGQPQASIYIGEKGGCAPFRVSHPLGAAASPRSHLGGRPRGERGNLPPKQGGAPLPKP